MAGTSFFHISKIDINDRNKVQVNLDKVRLQQYYGVIKSDSSRHASSLQHAQSIIHAKTFKPLRSDRSVEQQRENIVANNYVKFKQTGPKKAKRRLKKPIVFSDAYTNREVLQIPCFTFPKLNEQQIIKGRRTLCKFLNKGLISEPVERLFAVQDVSKLKQLLYKNERHLRRQYTKPKTLLLRNALDFKNLFCTLEETTSADQINKSGTRFTSKNNNSNDRTNDTLRQYYLKRLSARAPGNTDRTVYSNKFIEAAVRCYIEGFQWHITYLDLCAAKSATLRQKYATQQKQQQQEIQRQKRNSRGVKSDMNKCETVFITTTNIQHYHQAGDAQANDILVTKLNQLNLNSHNNNNNNCTLPTIVLTDCSEESSDTNSIIFINQSQRQDFIEIIDQLHTPAIACHVEARPPSN